MKTWMSSIVARYHHRLQSYLPLSICKLDLLCCEHSSAFIFDRMFFIFADNKDNHKVSDEFNIRPDLTMDCGVSCS